MSRLYGVKVDEKRWKIVEIDNKNYHSYKLIDKEEEMIYPLNYIIGVEQVADDEFLVYRRANYDNFEIGRYRFQNSTVKNLFIKTFSQFHFITDDKILFTYYRDCGPHCCGGIYSIKDNKMLEEGKWLNGSAIDVYNEEENSKETILYVEKEIYSHRLGNSKLLFTVDPESLEPNSDCYSQFRNDFIKVSSSEDIKNIESEEKESMRMLEKQIFEKEQEQLKKAKEKVLVRKRELK